MIDHYVVNKFLYDTDRNPEFVRRYIEDPTTYVRWWLAERCSQLLDNPGEGSAVGPLDDATRAALITYDFTTLYREGAHPFILWTLMIPVLEDKLTSGEFVISEQPADARAENNKPMAYYREHIVAHGRPDFRY